jgi:hypothetical protein
MLFRLHGGFTVPCSHVSSSRRVKRSRRIYRTPLSCRFRPKGYETYSAGSAFGVRLKRRTRYLLNNPSSS